MQQCTSMINHDIEVCSMGLLVKKLFKSKDYRCRCQLGIHWVACEWNSIATEGYLNVWYVLSFIMYNLTEHRRMFNRNTSVSISCVYHLWTGMTWTKNINIQLFRKFQNTNQIKITNIITWYRSESLKIRRTTSVLDIVQSRAHCGW